MKEQILKIAGVKDEKSFYKLFPTEEAFMAKYGGKFKKAQMGAAIGSFTGGQKTTPIKPLNFNSLYDEQDRNLTGMDNNMRQEAAYKQSMLQAQQAKGTGGGGILGGLGEMLPMIGEAFGKDDGKGIEAIASAFEYGGDIPKAQTGVNLFSAQQSLQNYDPNNPSGINLNTQLPGNTGEIQGAGRGTASAIPQTSNTLDKIGGAIGEFAPMAEQAVGIFQKFKEEKEKRIAAEQMRDVSALSLRASAIRPEESERRYARPEDIQNTGEEFFSIYEAGTNVLAKYGREIPKAQTGGGFSQFMQKGNISNTLSSSVGDMFNNNAGSQVGAMVGDALGYIPIVGGAVKAIAKPILRAVGGAFGNKNAQRQRKSEDADKRNMLSMSGGAMGQGLQQQYQSYMEDGGEISDMEMGGELEIYDGDAETMSYNPFLPDGGETVMFNGPSHDRGGMPITYGQSPVEVEGGESAVKLQDGGQAGEENLVVFGDLEIPKGMLEDPNTKGKKFKGYIKALSKQEAKQNKIVDKSSKELEGLTPITSFDKLKLDSLEANIKGANMRLKSYAERKMDAAAAQSAINDTAEEMGIVAKDLAKGKYQIDKKVMLGQAKYGRDIPMAQEGDQFKVKGINKGSIDYNKLGGEGLWKDEATYKGQWIPKVKRAFADKANADRIIVALENYSGQDADDVKEVLTKETTREGKIKRAKELATDRMVGPYHSLINNLIDTPIVSKSSITPIQGSKIDSKILPYLPNKGTVEPKEQEAKDSGWWDMINSVLPNFRESDTEALDYNQLTGEMYAMSNNQLEPVQAQSYQPQLDVPYDISFQDQLNANQSDYRSGQRMVGYNSAAQGMLNAQKYDANSKILAEQFRANQAKKDQVYSGNRATMNDAQLKNLAIFDQQYTRQAQAKSNTKEATQAALNSMSDKFAKHKLDNRKLAVYENLYNYRYDDKFRAQNRNPFLDIDAMIDGAGQNGTAYSESISDIDRITLQEEALKNKKAELLKQRKAVGGTADYFGRNGAIVKALKKY